MPALSEAPNNLISRTLSKHRTGWIDACPP